MVLSQWVRLAVCHVCLLERLSLLVSGLGLQLMLSTTCRYDSVPSRDSEDMNGQSTRPLYSFVRPGTKSSGYFFAVHIFVSVSIV